MGLERDPSFAIVDRLIELAKQREAPTGVFHPFGVVIFPFEPLARGLVGGDQCGVEALCDGPSAADFDPEGHVEVIGSAGDPRGGAEQGMKCFDMVTDRGAGLG